MIDVPVYITYDMRKVKYRAFFVSRSRCRRFLWSWRCVSSLCKAKWWALIPMNRNYQKLILIDLFLTDIEFIKTFDENSINDIIVWLLKMLNKFLLIFNLSLICYISSINCIDGQNVQISVEKPFDYSKHQFIRIFPKKAKDLVELKKLKDNYKVNYIIQV